MSDMCTDNHMNSYSSFDELRVKTKKSLIKSINYEMEQLGNTDVVIDNIQLFTEKNKQYAMADVSYTWWLNAWDKRVCHKDMIFVLVDNDRWLSPIFG